MEFTPITHDDLAFVNEVRNECAEYLHDPRQFTMEQTKEWFLTGPKFWIIWHDKKRIGYFRTSNHIGSSIYIGADLHKDFRGCGLAFTAYKLFLPVLIAKYDLSSVFLEVLETNTRAISLYEKLGFNRVSWYRMIRNESAIKSIIMRWNIL